MRPTLPPASTRRRYRESCTERIVDVNDPLGRIDLRVVVSVMLVVSSCIILIFTFHEFVEEQRLSDVSNPLDIQNIMNFVCSLLYLLFQTGSFFIIHEYAKVNDMVDNFDADELQIEVLYRTYSFCMILMLILDACRGICYNTSNWVAAYIFSLFHIIIFLGITYRAAERLQSWAVDKKIGWERFRHAFPVFVIFSWFAFANIILLTLVTTSSNGDYFGKFEEGGKDDAITTPTP